MLACLQALAETYPGLHHGLPGQILGMRFAGDDELHRALAVCQDTEQPLGVMQQETRAFIRGEAAREAQVSVLGSNSRCVCSTSAIGVPAMASCRANCSRA
jgi:hypothetical protein